ncbi:MAG: peptidoglycan endopeptidase [Haliea sp.]|nr:MAG: peptidoglycan endopeptidase [Haliea sp.]
MTSSALRPPRDTRRVATAAFVAALALALSGCASSPSSRNSSSNAAPRLSLDEANDVTLYALGLVGTPYRYGGNTPETGFDCSGLIGHVYRVRADIASPRTVASLSGWGQPVNARDARTGDLVVFTQGGAATHAGIYVGEGRFVHAPSTGGTVRLDRLSSTYWSRQPTAFRRP